MHGIASYAVCCRLLAGGVAGALSRGSVAPLERLRTLMMADNQNRHLFGELVACLACCHTGCTLTMSSACSDASEDVD